MKIKTQLIIVMLLISTTLSITTNVIAHPPQDMSLEYDIDMLELYVTIRHETPAPTVHYVNKVEIKLNDSIRRQSNPVDIIHRDKAKFAPRIFSREQAFHKPGIRVHVQLSPFGGRKVQSRVARHQLIGVVKHCTIL